MIYVCFESLSLKAHVNFSYNIIFEKGEEVFIVTGDRDTFQLISKNTKILYTKRGISEIDVVDEKFFTNKYGLKTEQYIEYLALKGDPSDNIPGLAGVGEKTATSLRGAKMLQRGDKGSGLDLG